MKVFQITAATLALFATLFSTSCAATKGFGQDLQKVGSRIENRADATGGARPDVSTVPTGPTSAY
jgi:predicted small secreted protein